jgi:transcriptional regulator with XRE-family HTH domain
LISETKTPEPMDIALGAAIRIRRRTLGVSQEALSEQCGVTFQQIQKYENGANRISFSRLVRISKALGCRVGDLLGALDVPDEATVEDLDLLIRTRRPGAIELLAFYEQMPQAARTALLALVKTLGRGTDPILTLETTPAGAESKAAAEPAGP